MGTAGRRIKTDIACRLEFVSLFHNLVSALLVSYTVLRHFYLLVDLKGSLTEQ